MKNFSNFTKPHEAGKEISIEHQLVNRTSQEKYFSLKIMQKMRQGQ